MRTELSVKIAQLYDRSHALKGSYHGDIRQANRCNWTNPSRRLGSFACQYQPTQRCLSVPMDAQIQNPESRSISSVLGEISFRNGLGYAVFFLVVTLPTVDSWQSGSEVERLSEHPGGRSQYLTRNLPTWRDGRPSVREQMNRSWWPTTSRLMWLFGKATLAMLGATVSLMILMPFRGCKRYAILFGPPTGLLVVTTVGLWLAGRTEIYRFEPVVIAVVAALPTTVPWFFCCKWAYASRIGTESIIEAELVE